MEVRYIHQSEYTYGNILWAKRFPMRAGRFPREHPCVESDKPFTMGDTVPDDSGLGRFRAKGYWVSCFPEGDGITLKAPDNKTPDDVRNDIRECFGWEVVDKFTIQKEARDGC